MWYRWFGTFYILVAFVMVPLLLFAFSFLISLGPGGIVLNIILDVPLIVGAVLLIYKIDVLGWLVHVFGGAVPARTSTDEVAI